MNSEIPRKNIILYSIFVLILIIIFELFVRPKIYVKQDYLGVVLRKITSAQTIAPQRLYINVWRMTRNKYIDKTFNHQNWLKWRNRYSSHIKTMEDANVAINTMLLSLNDPYTKFLKSGLFLKRNMILDSKITGIGVLFGKSGDEITVNHIMENSPAQNADILPGDKIVAVNDTSSKNVNIDELMESIEDGKIDKVKLTIKRKDSTFEKELKKEDIPIGTMDYEITPDNIGIITMSNIMGKNAVVDFKNILLKTNETKALIFDLRNNYGGILSNAIEMANYMLNNTEIVAIESGTKSGYHIYADDEVLFQNKPIVILINNNTASAAEIFAGTLRDNLNAILIGENTYGKNSIQHVIPIQNHTGLILTTEKYILPKGEDIYKVGLKPDMYMKQDSLISDKNDEQMNEAKKLINKIMENK